MIHSISLAEAFTLTVDDWIFVAAPGLNGHVRLLEVDRRRRHAGPLPDAPLEKPLRAHVRASPAREPGPHLSRARRRGPKTAARRNDNRNNSMTQDGK
ncbi:hypothetical protein MY4824_004853 [Beauveria thailandica]